MTVMREIIGTIAAMLFVLVVFPVTMAVLIPLALLSSLCSVMIFALKLCIDFLQFLIKFLRKFVNISIDYIHNFIEGKR